MANKEDHPFYCHKKRTRKTAWDTPEYLTDADWELAAKMVVVKTGLDYAGAILDAFNEGTAEGFFNRVLGWPEGFHYCRSTSFVESSAWPGFVQHEREKLKFAVETHKAQFNLF